MNRAAKVVVIGGSVALLGGLTYQGYARLAGRVPRQVGATVAPAPPPSTVPSGMLADPLVPDRPVRLDSARASASDDWVKARPQFQSSRSAAERGGVEPCASQPVDTSGFSAWTALGRGRYTLPKQRLVDDAGGFRLVIHLHGEEPVLRELISSEQPLALYTLTLPPEQGYAPLFSGTHLYEQIVAQMERAVAQQAGRDARAERVVLSAWSAGFVGVEAALAQPVSKDVDAVVLVDGLHGPRNDPAAFKAQMQPFVDFATRAAAGERFLFVSHSSIDSPDFASTTESAHYLIATLGGRPQPAQREDALGLQLVDYFSRGDFHVRGYAGNDKADHCAQLGVLRDVYRGLGQRWARR